jgi:CheY-like chemotaxis protein
LSTNSQLGQPFDQLVERHWVSRTRDADGVIDRIGNRGSDAAEAEFKLGSGTSFTLRLPKAASDEEVTELPALEKKGTGTVLRDAEDNPDVASASTGFLEQLGYNVRWVSEASSALDEIERDGIDIVCSDIVMPGKMDGIVLAQAIREKRPTMPILLMTGYAEAARDSTLCFPILRKPYHLHELSRELDKLRP